MVDLTGNHLVATLDYLTAAPSAYYLVVSMAVLLAENSAYLMAGLKVSYLAVSMVALMADP